MRSWSLLVLERIVRLLCLKKSLALGRSARLTIDLIDNVAEAKEDGNDGERKQ
jgi:hypothetical protein